MYSTLRQVGLMGLRVSVLVCAWNRVDGVKRILQALEEQSLAHSDFEAVIVDNNSTDGTREVVQQSAAQASYGLRYILEERQGKCWALNTGIEASAGEIIACLDDDCVPDARWLSAIVEAFSDDEVAVLGGPCQSVFSEAVLGDPHRRFLGERFLGSFEPYERFTEISRENPPLGMNMAFRRAVAERVGGFDVELGPRPGRHIGREDTAFIRRAQSDGLRVFYTPDALVYHHIDDKRVTWEAIKRQAFSSGIGSSREKYHVSASTPLCARIRLSAVFCLEAVYAAIRIAVNLGNRRKRTVSAFRLAAARGKLAGVWADTE